MSISQPDPSSPPQVRADFGSGYYTPVLYRPAVLPAEGTGHVTLVLGNLSSGHELRIDVTDLAWLTALRSACDVAIAEGVIEAGMTMAEVAR